MATREQRQFLDDEQIRMANEESRRRQEEAAQAASLQSQQLQQNAQLQQQQDQQRAQQQAQIQAAQAQQQQGYNYINQANQFQYQSALSGQEAQQHQVAQQQAHQQGMQAATHHANLQAELSQVQLNQHEEMRLQRLQQAASAVDEAVHKRQLSPHEGADLRLQIETGLNPLEQRQQRAQILHTQIQTQGMYQQNEMQATLFNQRQAILATDPSQRIRYIPDVGYMRMTADGDWERIDINEYERRDQAHQLGMLSEAQGITQRAAMHPLQLAAARLGNEHLAAQTTNLQAMSPLQQQALIAETQLRVQQHERNNQLLPPELAQAWANVQRTQQETQQRGQMFPIQLRLGQAQAGMAETHLANEPARFATEQSQVRAQTRNTLAQAGLHEQDITQRAAMHPLQLEAARLGNDHLAAQTANLQALTGPQRDAIIAEVDLRRQQYARNNQMLPPELAQAWANVQATQQQTEQRGQLFPAQRRLLGAQAGMAETHLANEPARFATEQSQVRAQTRSTLAQAGLHEQALGVATEVHESAMSDARSRRALTNTHIAQMGQQMQLTGSQIRELDQRIANNPQMLEVGMHITRQANTIANEVDHDLSNQIANFQRNNPGTPLPPELQGEGLSRTRQARLRERIQAVNSATRDERFHLPVPPAPQEPLSPQEFDAFRTRIMQPGAQPLADEEVRRFRLTPQQAQEVNARLAANPQQQPAAPIMARPTEDERQMTRINAVPIDDAAAARIRAVADDLGPQYGGIYRLSTDSHMVNTLRSRLADPNVSRQERERIIRNALSRMTPDIRSRFENALRGQ